MHEADRVIGDSPQLFFDDLLIEMVQDVRRVYHRPEKRAGMLIRRDRPWEAILSFNDSPWDVLYDEGEGIFRCWYEDAHYDFDRMRATNVDITDPRVSGNRVCYAHSRDGLNWMKPDLNVMPLRGKPTNIVFGDWDDGKAEFGSVHVAAVLDDALEEDSAKRFKMIFQHITAESPETDVTTDTGDQLEVLQSPMRLATSPDGIHWTVDPRGLDFGGLGPRLGDSTRLTQDVDAGHYILYTRHPNAWNPPLNPKNPRSSAWSLPYYPEDPAKMNKRRVWRCESRDLIQWNEPYEVMVPDDTIDNLDESFNVLGHMRVGDIYVGFPSVLQTVANTKDVQLAYSRDGIRWQRVGKRRPFIPNGEPGAWDSCLTSLPTPPIERGDELWVYYGGSNYHHNWWMVGSREGLDLPEVRRPMDGISGMGLAILRKEGFVSLNATVREGIIVTRPLRLSGEQLMLNAVSPPDGYLDVEVADLNDDVLSGLSRAEFIRFSGDTTRADARWSSGAVPPTDREVKLRFFMRHCDLYSLCASNRA